jgi:hypothetical protein
MESEENDLNTNAKYNRERQTNSAMSMTPNVRQKLHVHWQILLPGASHLPLWTHSINIPSQFFKQSIDAKIKSDFKRGIYFFFFKSLLTR